MADKENYQMAIDLLSCHLGLSEEEAKERLGLIEKKIRPNFKSNP